MEGTKSVGRDDGMDYGGWGRSGGALQLKNKNETKQITKNTKIKTTDNNNKKNEGTITN